MCGGATNNTSKMKILKAIEIITQLQNKSKMEKQKLRVVSLFDGMSCGRIALEKAGKEVAYYYASEIDKYAIKISEKNYPDIIRIGDVTKVGWHNYTLNTDLLIGGSPCQSFSVAGDNTGFEGKSGLFWEFVKALKEIKPKYFLLENVVMKKEWEDVITEALGVKPIKINSACFTAQNRNRLYWTNIPIDMDLTDSGLYLKDILMSDYSETTVANTDRNLRHERDLNEKSLTCTATMYKGAGNNGMTLVRRKNQSKLSVLSVNEVEKLQGVPLNYTEGVSNTQRYKMLGNGWTVDVIAHIFKNL
jgi:site-specific DNA-cytosine methylase